MDEMENRLGNPTGQKKESHLTSQLVIYRTEILMVGIIDVNFHPKRTWNNLRQGYANGLGTRGSEIKGSMTVLFAIASLPEIGNCSGTADGYLGSEMKIERAWTYEGGWDCNQIDACHNKRFRYHFDLGPYIINKIIPVIVNQFPITLIMLY